MLVDSNLIAIKSDEKRSSAPYDYYPLKCNLVLFNNPGHALRKEFMILRTLSRSARRRASPLAGSIFTKVNLSTFPKLIGVPLTGTTDFNEIECASVY